jgi:hypothetical protein
MLEDVGVIDVREEGGMDELARGAEEQEQGRGLGALADVLMDGGAIWSLGMGTLEWSLDRCEGILLVYVARIMRVNRISCTSSFDPMCSS